MKRPRLVRILNGQSEFRETPTRLLTRSQRRVVTNPKRLIGMHRHRRRATWWFWSSPIALPVAVVAGSGVGLALVAAVLAVRPG